MEGGMGARSAPMSEDGKEVSRDPQEMLYAQILDLRGIWTLACGGAETTSVDHG